MNVRHMTKARANTHLLISVYFSSGTKLINIFLTLIPTAGMYIPFFPFVSSWVFFFSPNSFCSNLCTFCAYFAFETLLKHLLQVHFRTSSIKSVYFFAGKGERALPRKVAISKYISYWLLYQQPGCLSIIFSPLWAAEYFFFFAKLILFKLMLFLRLLGRI